jgi:alkanesulfonate monooxygenase SsuD/methylene tetrahydromethanopterin reductase-like flavin-dependent oxidoreductase (luciferase family)
MGAVAPKMLRLAGAISDGVILPLLAGQRYIRWAAKQIAAGRADAGRDDPCRLVVFAFFSVANSEAKAKIDVRRHFATYLHLSAGMTPLFAIEGMTEELQNLGMEGPAGVDAGLHRNWMDDLAVIGDPESCAARIQGLRDAGADSVVLFPMPDARAEDIVERAARDVLPLLA